MIPKDHKELRDLHEEVPGFYGIFAKASNDDAVLVGMIFGRYRPFPSHLH
jgi:hypothetical protein